jgi:gamma-aminobutyric acid receptor subunit rho
MATFTLSAALILALVLGVAHSQSCTKQCSGPRDVTDYIKQVLNSPSYRPKDAPCELPVHVETQFKITYMSEILENLGQVAVGGYWRQWWTDPRLAFNDTKAGGCFDSVSLSNVNLNTDIWAPNLYVDNGVDARHSKNLIIINPDGSVWFSAYSKITVKANLHFARLPFDEHTVVITIASYSLGPSIVRLTAKGGSPGADGGVGVLGEAVESPVWTVEKGEEISTEAHAYVLDGPPKWEYVDLHFGFARKPKFLVDQVLTQDFLFLLLTYCGFFISPAAVPARAALAVLPVLILRTMCNSVFRTLPQIGYYVWLADYLQVSMWLCVLSCVELAVVQWLMQRESIKAKTYAVFKKSEPAIQKLLEIAHTKGVRLHDVINGYTPVEKDGRRISWFGDKDGWNLDELIADDDKVQGDYMQMNSRPRKVRGPTQAGEITEEQTVILTRIIELFKKFDKDDSGHVGVAEAQSLLSYFDIYMLKIDVATSLCRYMRDNGLQTPLDEMTVQVIFYQFLDYVFDAGELQKSVPIRFKHPLSKAYSGSIRCETFIRWFFPVFVAIKVIFFWAILALY